MGCEILTVSVLLRDSHHNTRGTRIFAPLAQVFITRLSYSRGGLYTGNVVAVLVLSSNAVQFGELNSNSCDLPRWHFVLMGPCWALVNAAFECLASDADAVQVWHS